MLELQSLILEPWHALDSLRKRRNVGDEGGAFLGFAEFGPAHTLPLVRWFSSPVVRVFETADAALLCLLRRRSGRRWEVQDAEDRPVGVCVAGSQRGRPAHQTQIYDNTGRRTASIVWGPNAQAGVMCGPSGENIGTIRTISKGTCIDFDTEWDGNPFSRMLILAAAIVEA